MDLTEIVEQFRDSDFQTTLDMLVDYSDDLPPLPEKYIPLLEKSENRVPECETPVFIWIEVNGGKVAIHAHVPEESPTVRGFVSILVDAFTGVSPEEVADAPPNLLNRLGLDKKLGTRRMYGLGAVYARIKKEVGEKARN
ncbi:MAG: SufE family protein [Candidatus Mycalebacterium zealandia]|nr:MAG: SufE family protein [Candidatus Mycalebacterium zealandia]